MIDDRLAARTYTTDIGEAQVADVLAGVLRACLDQTVRKNVCSLIGASGQWLCLPDIMSVTCEACQCREAAAIAMSHPTQTYAQ